MSQTSALLIPIPPRPDAHGWTRKFQCVTKSSPKKKKYLPNDKKSQVKVIKSFVASRVYHLGYRGATYPQDTSAQPLTDVDTFNLTNHCFFWFSLINCFSDNPQTKSTQFSINNPIPLQFCKKILLKLYAQIAINFFKNFIPPSWAAQPTQKQENQRKIL